MAERRAGPRALAVCGACVAALAGAGCGPSGPWAFPEGIYALSAVIEGHDCFEAPTVLDDPEEQGVFTDLEPALIPIATAHFAPGDSLVEFREVPSDEKRTEQRSGFACLSDGTSSDGAVVAEVTDERADGFAIEVSETFAGGATCVPVPADGCTVQYRLTYDLVLACEAGAEPDPLVPADPRWACVQEDTNGDPLTDA